MSQDAWAAIHALRQRAEVAERDRDHYKAHLNGRRETAELELAEIKAALMCKKPDGQTAAAAVYWRLKAETAERERDEAHERAFAEALQVKNRDAELERLRSVIGRAGELDRYGLVGEVHGVVIGPDKMGSYIDADELDALLAEAKGCGS